MSKEVRIGILTVIAIAILIWGYKFIRGQNILTASQVIYAEYDNVDYLKVSSPVLINGFQVGVVTDIQFKEGDISKLIVSFSIDRDVPVPKQTIAVITDQGFLGGKAIELRTDVPCDKKLPCPEQKNYRRGVTMSFLASVLGDPEELGPYFEEISSGVNILLDSLEKRMSEGGGEEGLGKSLEEMQEIITNLKGASQSLNRLLIASSGNIEAITGSLASITGNLEKNNEGVGKLIDNSAQFSESLNKLEMGKTLENANTTLEELTKTLEGAQEMLSSFDGMAQKLDRGDGTLGKMLNDDELYNQLSSLSARADSLMTDLQTRPYRYIPLKGRKKINRYDRKDAEEETEN
jgi:phospholipid/cholesterol/gamma-HCH transport system substrate-binding protein